MPSTLTVEQADRVMAQAIAALFSLPPPVRCHAEWILTWDTADLIRQAAWAREEIVPDGPLSSLVLLGRPVHIVPAGQPEGLWDVNRGRATMAAAIDIKAA